MFNNFPVQLTADYCKSEHIIGVHVGLHEEKGWKYDFDTSVSGWQVLLSQIIPFYKKINVPSLIGVITRSLEVNGLQSAREQEVLTDLMIKPNLTQFRSTDYGSFKPISQIGYDAAFNSHKEWKKNRLDFLSR